MYCSLTCFSAKFCQFLVTCSKVYDSNLGVRNYEAPCRTDGIFCRTVCLMLFFCSCYSNVAMNEFSIAMSLTNIIFVLFAHFLGLLHARHHSPAETSFGIFGAELFYTTLPTLQMLRFASVLSIPSWTRTIHFLSVWVEICLKWWCFRILFVCTDAFLCACACTCMWNSQCMQINVHCLNKNTETSYC